ncbi:MAG: phage holin family protein [Anaerolineales bacterium]|nr:phage holin family protein [Anaerolineales bacterium]
MTTYSNQQYYQREPTVGDLLSDLSAQASQLVHQEIKLAQAEMTQKASKAGQEIALIAVGGVLANAALLALVYAIILVLGTWMSLWIAALIVAIVVGIVAGILVWAGIDALKKINPAPTRTIATLQEDKEWLATQMK